MMYTYKCSKCQAQFIMVRPMDQRNDPAKCPGCQALAERDLVGDHKPTAHCPGIWPQHSYSLRCVDAEQAVENAEFDRAHGVPTEYDKNHCPIFTGPEHKKRYFEAHGYRDPLAMYNGAHGKFNRGEPPPVQPDLRADKLTLKETVINRAQQIGLISSREAQERRVALRHEAERIGVR